MKVNLKHATSGVTKKAKLGFSWTFFFFGLWIPLFRGDFKNLFRIWGLAIITIGIYLLIASFTYNKRYIQDLLEKGYVPRDEEARRVLADKGIIDNAHFSNPNVSM